ncbi:MAG: CinA family protein [Coprococcus catus]
MRRFGECKGNLRETEQNTMRQRSGKDTGSLLKLLIEKKITITTMESATSGLIASLITDTEGSSAEFRGAFRDLLQ